MRRPRQLVLLSLLFLGGLAAPADATLLFYDGFDYTAGEKLAPRNDTTTTANPGQLNVAYSVNWRYAGGGGAAQEAPGIANGTLSYPGLKPSTGNSAAHDQTMLGSARVQVAASAINSGTLYWSALLRVNDIADLTSGVNGMLLGGFNSATGAGTLPTVVGAVLRIRKDENLNQYYIGTGLSTGTGSGSGGNVVQFDNANGRLAGATVFVVGSYQFVSGAQNDVARLWINPKANTFEAASPPTATLTSAPGSGVGDPFTSLISFNLRNVNTVGNPAVQFDELRVGTTWADVTPVPEPAALAMVLAGCVACSVRAGLTKLRRL